MLRGLRTSSVTDLVSEVMIICDSAHVENSSRQQIVTCRYYKKIEDVKFYSKLTTIGWIQERIGRDNCIRSSWLSIKVIRVPLNSAKPCHCIKGWAGKSYNAVLLVFYATLILSEVKFRMELRFCKSLGYIITPYTIHGAEQNAAFSGNEW